MEISAKLAGHRFWTAERREEAVALWKQGLSATQIANTMGAASRNAVLGVLHRMGANKRPAASAPSLANRKPKAISNARARGAMGGESRAAARARLKLMGNGTVIAEAAAKPARESIQVIKDPPGLATSLTLGPHMCKWPIGDPAAEDFTFCGKKSLAEQPYCAIHQKRAVQPFKANAPKTGNQLARSLRRFVA